MKTYKGYELIKLINDNELKTGTKIKVKMGNSYITTITYEDFGLKWNPGEFDTSVLCSSSATFELIEEDIDIQDIEELDTYVNGNPYIADSNIIKINKILQWAKQVDREIKELKEKDMEYMTEISNQ